MRSGVVRFLSMLVLALVVASLILMFEAMNGADRQLVNLSSLWMGLALLFVPILWLLRKGDQG